MKKRKNLQKITGVFLAIAMVMQCSFVALADTTEDNFDIKFVVNNDADEDTENYANDDSEIKGADEENTAGYFEDFDLEENELDDFDLNDLRIQDLAKEEIEAAMTQEVLDNLNNLEVWIDGSKYFNHGDVVRVRSNFKFKGSGVYSYGFEYKPITYPMVPWNSNYPTAGSVWEEDADGYETDTFRAAHPGKAKVRFRVRANNTQPFIYYYSDYVEFTVYDWTGTPTITPNGATMVVGDTQFFTSNLLEGFTDMEPGREDKYPGAVQKEYVEWNADNYSIISVKEAGVLDKTLPPGATITALRPGTATLTANVLGGAYEKSVTITVTQPATGVTVSPATATVQAGATTKLTGAVLPSNASNTTLTWSSSNTAVATVNSSGTVTGVAPGTAVITARSHNNYSASAAITVTAADVPVTGVSVTPANTSLDEGETVQLTAGITPSNATNKNISWSSSNTAVATVDNNGLVTALSGGSATITATAHNNVKGTAAITVSSLPVDVSSVTITPSVHTMNAAETYQLTATITPDNATNTDLTWRSSDINVLTVDSQGKITAISPGNAIVTATTHNGKIGIATITVEGAIVPVAGLALDPAAATIAVGQNLTINPVFTPANATNTAVTWMSSNPAVADIDANGVVTAKATGFIAVIATTVDGGYMAFSNITITEGAVVIPVESIHLNKNTMTVAEGQTEQLQVTFNPANATDRRLEWTSSDPSKAVVDQDGNVTGIAEGNTIIFVKSVDGSRSDLCTVTVSGPGVPQPSGNLALNAVASASSQHNNNRRVAMINDGDQTTSWLAAADDDNAYVSLNFGQSVTLNQIVIDAAVQRIGDYTVEYWNGSSWIEVDSGFGMGRNYTIDLPVSIATTEIRINMTSRFTSGAAAYAIFEVEAYQR